MIISSNVITKIKLYLLFIICGLPGCCLLIVNIKLRLSLILTIIFLSFYCLFRFKYLLKKIFNMVSDKNISFLNGWLVWCFISGLTMSLFSQYSFAHFLYYFIFHGILLVYIPLFLSYDLAKKINMKKMIKYYFIFLSIILFLGLLNYIFLHSNITFLQTFFTNYITNTRTLIENNAIMVASLKRVQATFVEPSYFANFICLNLPIIYLFSQEKYNIFKNKYVNFIIKKSLIILSWFLLVCTKSPIFLIFAILLTIFFFAKNKKEGKVSIKHIMFFLFALLLIVIAIVLVSSSNYKIDLTATYIKRILNTIPSLFSIETLITAEPSLATRIINMYNQFILFLKHPILGVGYGNIMVPLNAQFSNSPVPLTAEIRLALESKGMANLFVFWTTLAETGFVGFVFLYTFLIKTLNNAKILFTYLKQKEQLFIKSLYYSLLFFTLTSIYDGEFGTHILMIIGLILGYYSKVFRQYKQIKKVKVQGKFYE